ncbi:unnamed protein product [Cuscuta epithymum]|uniref:Uncharacterized protein n=1 Tax=Cuscuta epithymum TaxID=186058 RepID=A0AAV0CLT5_9ASTE|nr:unnamed protein product [Cuscuta epithymum]
MLRILPHSLTAPSTVFPRLFTRLRRSNSNSSGGGEDDVPLPHLIEIDLDSSTTDPNFAASSDPPSDKIHKLDDAIYTFILRRSAPDWLPFIPGSSFWVPPRHFTAPRPLNIVDVIRKISAAKSKRPSLSDDELMASFSPVGWPSFHYFFPGSAPTHPVTLQVMEVKVKIQENPDDESEREANED